ncbi:putative bifunctional diguanylate cyclase/phosphodiesterase [Salinisphaera hydrothermalis]|uniref:Diguanylate cyclase/phosphodiesterase n=1 Tax=Salinisphaera hydrothermalis (strain C41B8) TaxID=1304275 RepID=A0A084IH92_SALHC|nr:EAL domain-containing protein [Salinisphaera hydrothermalis]KEZ76076.1 diguanylate cyclase/phosphodiesterase [Salinisphaera hydrothermalis C41B8]
MRLTLAAFRGMFARRLFLRFMIAAGVPVLILGPLAYFNISQVMLDQASGRLRQSSRNEGMAILDRLSMAADRLRYFGLWKDDTQRESNSPFTAIAYISGEGRAMRVDQVRGQLSDRNFRALARRARRQTDKPVVDVVSPGVVDMAVTVGQGRHTGVAIGRLALDNILGGVGTWPTRTRFCVFTVERGQSLNCPDARHVFIVTSNPDRTRVRLGSESMLFTHWDLFLQSSFQSPMWRIVALQPMRYVGRSAHTFYWLMPLLLLLSLLFAGLVGLMQIRRVSGPLRKLHSGVQAIARGEFDTRVDIDSRDEFESLANSINGMAARLGMQFHMLDTLAAVDRHILAASDVGDVLERILAQMPRIVTAQAVGLIALDPDLPYVADSYRCRTRTGAPIEIARVALGDAGLKQQEATPSVWQAHADAPVPAPLRHIAELGVARVDVLPARDQGRLWALLLLGYDEHSVPVENDRRQAEAVADRMAVALAASHRSEQLYRQAHFDALTGLPNRQLFMDRADTQQAHARQDERGFAVLFVDLDRFKNVNDAAGHSAGDGLLRLAGERIHGILRDIDTAARWGGDEFVVLLSDVERIEEVARVCEHLIAVLSEPYTVASIEYRVGASIGIAMYPGDGDTVEQLLANADAAMYEAKAAGRGCHVFFEDRMNETIRRRIQLERELRQALAEDQFFLHYQPLICPETGDIGGAEALLRWQHPERGVVSPGEFVPALEESGLIVEAGEWVLREATRQMAAGFGADGRAPARVMVNVSPRQFWAPGFLVAVDSALAESGIDPACLEIEITENLLLADLDAASRIAHALRARGIHLAMDDFGTGYSSLSYLRELPVDTVKIDRVFAQGAEVAGSEAATMVDAMIRMLHALGRRVVVEGIENAGQYSFVREAGADLAQGFYMSRPVLPAQLYDYHRPELPRCRERAADTSRARR